MMKCDDSVIKILLATAITAVIGRSPIADAQNCAASTRASNPTEVYAINTVNGTVTDTRTGLMWDRCPQGQSGAACTGIATSFTWAQALNVSATIGSYKGYSDWRLPSVKELRSLVEECRVNPSINEFAFPAASGNFWSSSAVSYDAASAWFVNFNIGVANRVERNVTRQVRLVRAGQ